MKTIKDVARLSGVSLTTVSRVINGSEKVSKKTKDKKLLFKCNYMYITSVYCSTTVFIVSKYLFTQY